MKARVRVWASPNSVTAVVAARSGSHVREVVAVGLVQAVGEFVDDVGRELAGEQAHLLGDQRVVAAAAVGWIQVVVGHGSPCRAVVMVATKLLQSARSAAKRRRPAGVSS